MRRFQIQTPIKEFLSGEPIASISPDDPVTVAVETMRKNKWDCSLVLEGGKLVGIFTERDFLNRVSAEHRNPAETKLREVMTPAPETLRAHDSIAYAINRMVVRGFRNIPIVDDGDEPIAVLDVRDVMAHLSELFAEVMEMQAGNGKEWDEWTDIGGGA